MRIEATIYIHNIYTILNSGLMRYSELRIIIFEEKRGVIEIFLYKQQLVDPL